MQVIAAAQAFLASASDRLRWFAMARKTCSTLCSATCWRASDGIQWAVQSNLFGAPPAPPEAISEPELSPMLSGFAAYCDPSSLGEFEREVLRIVTGAGLCQSVPRNSCQPFS